MLTPEMLVFKRIVTTATDILVTSKLPVFRLRDLLLDVKKDWRDRLLANVSNPLSD
jgi:hypothetical protein